MGFFEMGMGFWSGGLKDRRKGGDMEKVERGGNRHYNYLGTYAML